MADWTKILSRGEVEDRRGLGPVMGGGAGIVGIVGILIYTWLTNDPSLLFNQLQSAGIQQQALDTSQFAGQDDYETFTATVLGSTNDLWQGIFTSQGQTYQPPKLVLFRGATASACGGASAQVGPHYCSADQTIYLDETFFDELTNTLGARGGDVAQAYVIAHEAGHHAQYLLGVFDQVETLAHQQPAQQQQLAVDVELQADCFAGLWGYSIKDAGVFEPEEFAEAIDAAAAVGDDRIQSRVQGQVNPETWTHGSAAQRTDWLNRGYNQGDLLSCDTFTHP